MRKFVFVFLIVVVCSLAIPSSVLARIFWAWHAGEGCIWYDENDDLSCTEDGVYIDADYFVGMWWYTSIEQEINGASIQLVTDCTDGYVQVESDEESIGLDFQGVLLIDIDSSSPSYSLGFYNGGSEPCVVESIEIIGGNWGTEYDSMNVFLLLVVIAVVVKFIWLSAASLFEAMPQ